jgi:hypothetical protein
MKVQTKSAGILDNFSDTSVLDEKELWPLARFLDFLDLKLGNRLTDAVYCDHQLREDMCILLNGRNIKVLPDGLNTLLKDGDSIFICIVISGG